MATEQGVRVAVEGCGHGTLNAIYASVARSCQERGWDGVDLLIIGGDFQATRNAEDLTVMSVPAKYRKMGDFHEYYSGARKAPYLTLFVGGNHEAAAYLAELYHGGWVAPNIYYLGAAGVLRLGPLRIAGMSGIWKGVDYRKPHHERLPFNMGDIRSFYHVRELDVRKLLQVREQVDIGISHDWPRAIERHGDQRTLFRKKPDFEAESREGTLGNPAAEYVMDRLRPPYWFSAHMHCKFSALKTYDPPAPQADLKAEPAGRGDSAPATAQASAQAAQNPDEIDLDELQDSPDEDAKAAAPPVSGDAEATNGVSDDLRAQLPASFARPEQTQHRPRTQPGQPVPETVTNTMVRFLALDKCLPGREFLQLCEIFPSNAATTPPLVGESNGPRYKLQYDPEWLAITRVFARDLVIGDRNVQVPPDLGEEHYRPLIDTERKWVAENIEGRSRLDVPESFPITAEAHIPGDPESLNSQPREYTNPQTEAFCELVGIPNLWAATDEERQRRRARGASPDEGNRGRGWRGGGRGHQGRGRGGFNGPGRGRGRRGRW